MQGFWSMRTKALHALAVLVIAVGLAAFLGSSMFSKQDVTLSFLGYTTNSMRERIALLEISNHSDQAVEWTLHSSAHSDNFVLAVTDLVETNGELRSVGMAGSSVTLIDHYALQFGVNELKAGERAWIEIRPYPQTRFGHWRERLSAKLFRAGLHRIAAYVISGKRVNGPVMP
jgi:hypothetical protein